MVRRGFAIAVLVAAAASAPVVAQDGVWEWENATELSFVSTGGNASSSTLGVKASLVGTADPSAFKIEVGGIRAQSELTTRTATGTVGNPVITETTVAQLTAENYFARGRYDRDFGRAFAFGGAGWDRNTFAGIQNRFALVGGVGRTFVNTDNGRFKADIGATYTIQKDVEPVPGADDAFGGVRVTIDATRRISESTDFASTLIADENLEERGDVRADWVNSLAFAISEGLAFKTSLQLLYDREPANIRVPLLDGGGNPTGTNVRIPGDTVDSILTLTLVIKL